MNQAPNTNKNEADIVLRIHALSPPKLTMLKTLISAFLLTCGCVSYVRPVGEWARPADLALHENSLAGVRVAVRCAAITSEGTLREQSRKVCSALETAMEALGAEVPDEGAETELTLWYIDHRSGAESCPPLLSMAHFMTGYWIPCKSHEWSEAELRVTDARGSLLERAPLRIEQVSLQSWLFLPSSLGQGGRDQFRRRELQSRFLRFAQNRIYSQSMRLPGRAAKELE
jgi:hypothetical protein